MHDAKSLMIWDIPDLTIWKLSFLLQHPLYQSHSKKLKCNVCDERFDEDMWIRDASKDRYLRKQDVFKPHYPSHSNIMNHGWK